jgi:hypothetical protein
MRRNIVLGACATGSAVAWGIAHAVFLEQRTSGRLEVVLVATLIFLVGITVAIVVAAAGWRRWRWRACERALAWFSD